MLWHSNGGIMKFAFLLLTLIGATSVSQAVAAKNVSYICSLEESGTDLNYISNIVLRSDSTAEVSFFVEIDDTVFPTSNVASFKVSGKDPHLKLSGNVLLLGESAPVYMTLNFNIEKLKLIINGFYEECILQN